MREAKDSQGMCMLRHGPGPEDLASRVGLARFQHSAPGALKKQVPMEGEAGNR